MILSQFMNQLEIKTQIRCSFPAGRYVPYEFSDSHIFVSWHAVVEGSSTPYVCRTWIQKWRGGTPDFV